MPRLRALLALLALLALPAVASAQQEPGDKSITANGYLTFPKDGTNGSVFGGLGYYWTRQIEVQGNLGLFFSTSKDASGKSTSSTGTIVGAGANFNFATQGTKVYPYVGIEAQSVSSGGTSSTGFRPHGGFNDFLTRNSAINVDAGVNISSQAGSTSTPDVRLGFKFVF